MIDTKVIANYLPQFHRTPQNDMWWGEEYTDWVAVRNAKPLYRGHFQPNVPLDNNYYDLSNVESIKKQVKLANKAGVYGFSIYHYWFNDKQNFLTTPSELLLKDKTIDTHFLFIWDNGSWKRTWSAVKTIKYAEDWAPKFSESAEKHDENNGVLALLDYENEKEWTHHFEYLLPFFKDERYIKIENKPLFGIFHSDNEPEVLRKMITFWNELAIKNGFDGISTFSNVDYLTSPVTDYKYFYEPYAHTQYVFNFGLRVKYKIQREIKEKFPGIQFYKYDKVWRDIIKSATNTDKNIFPGAIVSYDDTPRRGNNGRVIVGSTPEKFEKYMKQLISISRSKDKEFIFLTAWNEWAEGAYLEPDERHGYSYLEALSKAIFQ